MDIITTQQLLERVSTLLRTEARLFSSEHGLQPVHLDVLRYLSMCNRYSDNAAAVADYLGLTKGTLSQSLKVLQGHGLIERHADPDDRRVVHLKVSLAGRQLVEQIVPSEMLKNALDAGDKIDFTQLQHQMRSLLIALQRSNQFKSFGQCHSCVHNITLPDGGYFCGLTQERLSDVEVNLICREHTVNHSATL